MPSHAMQDGDIIFNLRLMNQKMEEELRLYRNGTTPDNLLDLIDEKDAEISRLRKVSADSADKLRRIAKGSKDVIAKCDQLQKENEELKCLEAKRSTADAHTRATQQKQKQKQSTLSSSSKEITAAKQSIAELAQEVLALQAENETLNNSMDLLVPEADKYQELIEELEDDGLRRDSSIEKLQKRCHNLVLTQKGSRAELEESHKRALQEVARRKEQVVLLTAEIQKAQTFNAALKERVSTERRNAALLSTQLLAALADVTTAQKAEAKLKSASTAAAAAANSSKVKSKSAAAKKKAAKAVTVAAAVAPASAPVANDENMPPPTISLQEAAAKRKGGLKGSCLRDGL